MRLVEIFSPSNIEWLILLLIHMSTFELALFQAHLEQGREKPIPIICILLNDLASRKLAM